LKELWNAELVLIHVGHRGQKEEKSLRDLLDKTKLNNDERVTIVWESGKPGDRILAACKKENVDLLIAGALKKENLVQYYL
jgi:hypothetical protein